MADDHFQRPPTLAANAWTGQYSPVAKLSSTALGWGLSRHSGGPAPNARLMAPAPEAKAWDWGDPRVGWGLVLPENTDLAPAERASANDAPEPLQRLLAARTGSPVLRYCAGVGNGHLYRYDRNGGRRKLALVSPPGTQGRDGLPRYLLIAAGPDRIPWSFQYAANLSHFVGRLDLDGDALGRYVEALLGGWPQQDCDPRAPLIWSVNHDGTDITDLMDKVIARKVHAAFKSDASADFPRLTHLHGADATCARLLVELVTRRPALVVTTSHGMTGPLDDSALLRAQLGSPVDQAYAVLDIATLTAAWQPNGAIWYSHACCAAGSDTTSAYAGLLNATDLHAVLAGVAAGCGALVAPLPRALLGARRPLRAFVGHVEPTFDWTLRDPTTLQPLAHTIQRALYDRLYADGGGRPVAWALAQVFDDAGTMLALWADSLAALNKGNTNALDAALYYQIAALDRQHTVILGDPTVGVAALPRDGSNRPR